LTCSVFIGFDAELCNVWGSAVDSPTPLVCTVRVGWTDVTS